MHTTEGEWRMRWDLFLHQGCCNTENSSASMSPDSQRNGIPGQSEVCPQRLGGKELHVRASSLHRPTICQFYGFKMLDVPRALQCSVHFTLHCM